MCFPLISSSVYSEHLLTKHILSTEKLWQDWLLVIHVSLHYSKLVLGFCLLLIYTDGIPCLRWWVSAPPSLRNPDNRSTAVPTSPLGLQQCMAAIRQTRCSFSDSKTKWGSSPVPRSPPQPQLIIKQVGFLERGHAHAHPSLHLEFIKPCNGL